MDKFGSTSLIWASNIVYCAQHGSWVRISRPLRTWTHDTCIYAENFSTRHHLMTIQKEGKIYSACGDGKAAFISTTDIAAVAFRALTDEKTHNTDYAIGGAELLTHDEVRFF